MGVQDQDISPALQEQVKQAVQTTTPLCIRGGGSKDFYGRRPQGESIELRPHRGIVNYEPTELVISARCGTPLQEIEQALAAEGQMMPFEPPHFGATATLGGCIACNLSGPRRPYTGAVRDFVLGSRILNGRGEILSFGGEVMKNVAGYDVSRLMCGALGTLGVLLEVSLKVLPKPEHELTLRLQCNQGHALERLHAWGQRPYPLSASCFDGESLSIRLSGAERAVQAARQQIGGDAWSETDDFWSKLREHRHGFFATRKPLWRLSVTSDAPPVEIPDKCLIEWGGAQRWLVSSAPTEYIRRLAAQAGGHATLFRGEDRQQVFHPLPPALMKIHRRLKQAFDPHGIFNPGRLYEEI
jgi:glycolate oxidase FAD binding subunit